MPVRKSELVARQLPLKHYHFLIWFKWFLTPFPILTKKSRDKIRAGAHQRAQELKSRAFKERTALDPSVNLTKSYTPIGRLLRVAADDIGRKDHDISQYEARLEKDWYTKTEELESMTVYVLARYMPRRMADEVHKNLALTKSPLTSTETNPHFSLRRGEVDGDNYKRVS